MFILDAAMAGLNISLAWLGCTLRVTSLGLTQLSASKPKHFIS